MNRRAVLAAFDEQIRRSPASGGRGAQVERVPGLVRVFGGDDGWSGVVWSDLHEHDVDRAIADSVARFSRFRRPWEWKLYSYDSPSDLPERLRAAGLVPEPAESLLVAHVEGVDQDVWPPAGVELREISEGAGIDALVAVHDEVFGGDHSAFGRDLLGRLTGRADAPVPVLAVADGRPVAGARVEFHPGTEFASLWGGGTVRDWRGRGVFRSLVAHRARLAAARDYRYLQVDASADSRPILLRLGFVELATTTPYVHPGRS